MKYCQYKSSNCHSARSGCLLVFLNICSFRMFIDHVWLCQVLFHNICNTYYLLPKFSENSNSIIMVMLLSFIHNKNIPYCEYHRKRCFSILKTALTIHHGYFVSSVNPKER